MKAYKMYVSREYGELETAGCGIIFQGNDILFEFRTIELPLFTVPLKPNTVRTNCIPEGVYKVTKIYSPTKGQCFMVHNVPGRTAILIHKGNYATGKKVDTQGCILPGKDLIDMNKDGNLDVSNSTETMTELLRVLPDEFKLIIY